MLFELADRIAGYHEILYDGGVVACTRQPRRLQHGADRVGLHLFGAAHDKPYFRQIEVRGDPEIVNTGGKGGQADDRPQPDID